MSNSTVLCRTLAVLKHRLQKKARRGLQIIEERAFYTERLFGIGCQPPLPFFLVPFLRVLNHFYISQTIPRPNR